MKGKSMSRIDEDSITQLTSNSQTAGGLSQDNSMRRAIERGRQGRQSRRLRELFYDAVMGLNALGHADAAELADQAVDLVVDALRRDPSLPARSFADWSLVLADVRKLVAELIQSRIDGYIRRDDVIAVLERE
jgi:hypothetical protein